MTECIRRPHAVFTACKCPACRADQTRLKKRQSAGIGPLPRRSDEAWVVIDDLLRRGWNPRAIATAIGVPERTIRGSLYRRAEVGSHQWTRHTSALILDRNRWASQWPTEGVLKSVGHARRLRALGVLGWGLGEIHDTSGIHMWTLSKVRQGKTLSAAALNAERIRDAYDRLSSTPGPSAVVAQAARANGWHAPLDWHDIDIDDPDVTPAVDADAPDDEIDHAVIARVLNSQPLRVTAAELRAVLPTLVARELDDNEIGRLTHSSAERVRRHRRALGLAPGFRSAA